MKNFIRRLINLWRLSEYKIETTPELLDSRFKTLTKDLPTIEKKLATIIKESVDYFKPENGENTEQIS